jgi:hypothetical protein
MRPEGRGVNASWCPPVVARLYSPYAPRAVAIKGFIWTDHAEQRLSERGLACAEVERAIGDGHEAREANRGEADWRVHGT